jgi:hypothetical protein
MEVDRSLSAPGIPERISASSRPKVPAELRRKAEKLAKEIEGSSRNKADDCQTWDCDDEEDLFSAVPREHGYNTHGNSGGYPADDPGKGGGPEAVRAQPPTQASAAAPSQPPPPPPLPPEWHAVWSEEEGEYYFWHHPTNETRWDLHTMDEGAEEEPDDGEDDKAPEAEAEEEAPDSEEEEAEEEASSSSAEEAASNAQEEANDYDKGEVADGAPRIPLGQVVCTRHWWPAPGLQASCLKLYHGERLSVTWVDSQEPAIYDILRYNMI